MQLYFLLHHDVRNSYAACGHLAFLRLPSPLLVSQSSLGLSWRRGKEEIKKGENSLEPPQFPCCAHSPLFRSSGNFLQLIIHSSPTKASCRVGRRRDRDARVGGFSPPHEDLMDPRTKGLQPVGMGARYPKTGNPLFKRSKTRV